MVIKRTITGIFLYFAVVCMLPAQINELYAGQGDDLTVKIAIVGPGDELYFWWGHIALVIDNAQTGQSRFYDYGLFSLLNTDFFVNFAFGRLYFSTGVSPSEYNIAVYQQTNRSVTFYTLDILPERRERIRQIAEFDILPENRDYLYHHFNNNCSLPPIVELIDIATDGQFWEQFGNEPGRFVLRQHVRRHTWFSPFIDWFLNFLMGQNIDTPITVWEEMFLPSEVEMNIRDFQYTEPDGITRPLVSNVEVLNEAQNRPSVLEVPRKQWPRQLVFSLFVAAILGCFFYMQSRFPARGQVALGICHSLFGLVFGIAGLLLFFMSNFTEHDYTFNNANILFCNPLVLAAFPLGIRYAVSGTYDKRLRTEVMLRLLWLLVTLGIFASMLIKLHPQFWQDNLTDQMLMLPIALVLSLEPAGLKRLLQRIFWRWL